MGRLLELKVLRGEIVFVGCVVAALTGCSKNNFADPDTVKVTGSVTYEGRPVDGADVLFVPKGGKGQRVSSEAKTDAGGHFEMTTSTGGANFKPGLVPGKYVVAISKLDPSAVRDVTKPPKSLLPQSYADARKSKLSADVKEGQDNDFSFALKADGK